MGKVGSFRQYNSRDRNREKMLQSIPPECSMEKGKEYDDMISCTIVVSVSASCSKCYNLALS